jgi:alkanesulfonate monooxygenase SsuD/methylene tetrahydromethanopterin reductase-like flavin-dependent oxidoreductase (luciferase family)
MLAGLASDVRSWPLSGGADASLRRAARYADGWSPWLTQPQNLPARLDFLRSAPGFGQRPFDVCHSLAALAIGEQHVATNDPRASGGVSAQQIVDSCGELKAMGVTVTSVLPPPLPGLQAYLDFLRFLAAEVVPQLGS